MEDCNILNNNSSEDFFSEFCIEIEQNELKPRPKKQYIYTNEKKENKKKEVEKKQPKQRTEEELSKLFTEYPPSPFSCHTCNDTTQCKCNYKLSYDADDVEGYLQSLEKYGLAVIKDAISQEDCLQSANEFFNKGNQTADNEIEPINPSKPWSLESHIWTSSQKFIINIPPFTKQSFVNRFSPNIYKVFSNVFQQRELYCAIDDWGIFRPTKDLIYCKEKFLDVIKRKLKYNNEKHYGKFREDLPENKTPLPPPPLFDYLFYNIRFLECSEECANFPLIFYEKIENILKEFDQEFPSPPITFLDSNLHSSTYERADHLLSDLNDKNDENNKKCKGRCNLVVIDRKDWRTIRKLHFDLNPWKYLLDKEKGEKDLYQGVVAISDCPEEVGGFCCAPSSHLLLPQWCEENEGNSKKRHKTRIPKDDQIQRIIQNIPLRKGEMVIYKETLIHSIFPNISPKFRFIQLIRMLPIGKVDVDKDRDAAPRVLQQNPDLKMRLEKGEILPLSDLHLSLLSLLPWN